MTIVTVLKGPPRDDTIRASQQVFDVVRPSVVYESTVRMGAVVGCDHRVLRDGAKNLSQWRSSLGLRREYRRVRSVSCGIVAGKSLSYRNFLYENNS